MTLACLVLYALAMEGVSYYAHNIGLIGGLITIAGMLLAAHLYGRRQKRIEIVPPDHLSRR
jgi:hypothetical protein